MPRSNLQILELAIKELGHERISPESLSDLATSARGDSSWRTIAGMIQVQPPITGEELRLAHHRFCEDAAEFFALVKPEDVNAAAKLASTGLMADRPGVATRGQLSECMDALNTLRSILVVEINASRDRNFIAALNVRHQRATKLMEDIGTANSLGGY